MVTMEQIWGPQDRPTYTWAEHAPLRVFNSIKDNPFIGDERNFVRIRNVNDKGAHKDEVAARAGNYYEVYVYYHNNANPSLNGNGKGIANNVQLSMSIPAHIKAGKSAVIRGTISATNTQIECVWDSAYLTFDEEGVIRYVKNSAVIHNGGTANGQVLDANALLSDQGVKLADRNDVWGVIPGGADYAGYVTFELFVDRA